MADAPGPADFDPSTALCDSAVYRRGETICVFHAPSRPTEAWVRKVAKLSGQRVDWHYVAGYARVAFIGDRAAVRAAINDLLPALEASCKPEGFRIIESVE